MAQVAIQVDDWANPAPWLAADLPLASPPIGRAPALGRLPYLCGIDLECYLEVAIYRCGWAGNNCNALKEMESNEEPPVGADYIHILLEDRLTLSLTQAESD